MKQCFNGIDLCLQKIVNDEKVAIAMSRIYTTYGNNGTKWFCFKQSIVQNIPVSLVIHRALDIVPMINEIILGCLEGGLLKKWQSENLKIQKKQEVFIEKPIQFETFVGTYFIVVILWFLCVMTLIAELLIFRYTQSSKKPMKFFVLIEKVIFSNESIY